MEIELKITFDQDSLVALVEENVAKVQTPVPGTFKVQSRSSYGLPEVVATFVPASKAVEQSEQEDLKVPVAA